MQGKIAIAACACGPGHCHDGSIAQLMVTSYTVPGYSMILPFNNSLRVHSFQICKIKHIASLVPQLASIINFFVSRDLFRSDNITTQAAGRQEGRQASCTTLCGQASVAFLGFRLMGVQRSTPNLYAFACLQARAHSSPCVRHKIV